MADLKNKIEEGFVPGENQYVRMSKEEIREVALGAMTGQVFGSWQMSRHDIPHMHLVFLPLIGFNDFHTKAVERDEVIHVYGHLGDALNRAINGMPIFHTCRMIDAKDLERVFKMQDRFRAIDEDED